MEENCVYESDCHGIEMIKAPSGKECAIGGTNHLDRWKFNPWNGVAIAKEELNDFCTEGDTDQAVEYIRKALEEA